MHDTIIRQLNAYVALGFFRWTYSSHLHDDAVDILPAAGRTGPHLQGLKRAEVALFLSGIATAHSHHENLERQT